MTPGIALALLLQAASLSPMRAHASEPASVGRDEFHRSESVEPQTGAEVERAESGGNAESRGSSDVSRGDTPRTAEPPEVALSTLRGTRGQWLGREVRFTLQFESQVERWNPWLTRFAPKLYRGFQAWSDEQILWRSEDFGDVAPRLFTRRGTEVEAKLAAAARYERFRVRARVSEIFLDEPWIEILEAERLPERVGEGTILHAARGIELMDEGRFQLATNELDRAAAVPFLPPHAAQELAKLRELCAAAVER